MKPEEWFDLWMTLGTVLGTAGVTIAGVYLTLRHERVSKQDDQRDRDEQEARSYLAGALRSVQSLQSMIRQVVDAVLSGEATRTESHRLSRGDGLRRSMHSYDDTLLHLGPRLPGVMINTRRNITEVLNETSEALRTTDPLASGGDAVITQLWQDLRALDERVLIPIEEHLAARLAERDPDTEVGSVSIERLRILRWIYLDVPQVDQAPEAPTPTATGEAPEP